MSDAADVLRRFNRSHTQRVGALSDSFLGSGRSLGPNRLLFEIGPDGAAVLDLRERLALDSGYVSRMVRQLETDGLVTTIPDPVDGRRRLLRLTAAGLTEWRSLDDRSEALAETLVAPLSDRQRATLTAALDTADRLLRAATVEFVAVDAASPDARRAVGEYVAELAARFPQGFDPGDALASEAAAFSPPHGAFLLARCDGVTIGCGGVQHHHDDANGTAGEIKRMWIDASWRGLGLGRRQLDALEASASGLGYRRVVLDTNGTLTEAVALYEGRGYRSIERYNDNPYAQRWFAKDF